MAEQEEGKECRRRRRSEEEEACQTKLHDVVEIKEPREEELELSDLRFEVVSLQEGFLRNCLAKEKEESSKGRAPEMRVLR